MSQWLNTKHIIWEHAIKPCRIINFCPYGQIVEEFPLGINEKLYMVCEIFGHMCPVYYHAEPFCETSSPSCEEIDKFDKEIEEKYK